MVVILSRTNLGWVLAAVLGLDVPSFGTVSPTVQSPPANASPSRSITSSSAASSACSCPPARPNCVLVSIMYQVTTGESPPGLPA